MKDNNATADRTSASNNSTAGEEEAEEEENKKKENEEEEGEEKEKVDKEPDLFQLVVVNSYGSQEVQRLKDDDKSPLKLSSECVGVCVCVFEKTLDGSCVSKLRECCCPPPPPPPPRPDVHCLRVAD